MSNLALPPSEPIPLRDLLDIFATSGLTVTILQQMREWGFVPRPDIRSLGDAGTVSLYPASPTVPIIRRYLELKAAAGRDGIPRNQNDWLWRMWLEGQPVDMRSWALRRFDDMQKMLDKIDGEDAIKFAAGKTASKPGALRARVKLSEDRETVLSWALSVARGEVPEVSINNVEAYPSPIELVHKIGGMVIHLPLPPLENLRVEESSIMRLRDIIDWANDADMECARNDLYLYKRHLDTIPLDKLPRHARRSLASRRLSITQDTINFLRAIWREYDARAIFLAKSIEWTSGGGKSCHGRAPGLGNVLTAR